MRSAVRESARHDVRIVGSDPTAEMQTTDSADETIFADS